MPPRGRDELYSKIGIPEIRAMSVEPYELDVPIANAGAQEANFSIRGVDLNDMQDIIDEYNTERQREAERQTLAAAMRRLTEESQDAFDALAQAAKVIADGCETSFMDALNALREKIGDDFELADEEEYVVTDPISFDELMGGCCGDN